MCEYEVRIHRIYSNLSKLLSIPYFLCVVDYCFIHSSLVYVLTALNAFLLSIVMVCCTALLANLTSNQLDSLFCTSINQGKLLNKCYWVFSSSHKQQSSFAIGTGCSTSSLFIGYLDGPTTIPGLPSTLYYFYSLP